MNDIERMQVHHLHFLMRMEWYKTKTPLEGVALIHEEVVELGRELRQHEIDLEKTGDEMADIILRTIGIASEMDIDIANAITRKLQFNNDHVEEYKEKGRKI